MLLLMVACTAAPAPEAGECNPGLTRTCVGEGACEGGQQCLPDGTWDACGCGDDAADDTPIEDDADADTDTDADTDADTSAATELDMSEVILTDNPPDLADWPIGTRLTLVEFGDAVRLVFDKQEGEDRWPDVTPPGWDGPLQYTLGLAEYIDGQWYGSAAIQFWYGLESSGGNVALDDQVAVNWYYDGRWGALEGRQPETGETVGVFVVAGNVRGVTDGSQSPVMERSNIVLCAFPDVGGAIYAFE
jgi:hypothetical protein